MPLHTHETLVLLLFFRRIQSIRKSTSRVLLQVDSYLVQIANLFIMVKGKRLKTSVKTLTKSDEGLQILPAASHAAEANSSTLEHASRPPQIPALVNTPVNLTSLLESSSRARIRFKDTLHTLN
ncbi:hypothetical protein FRC11_011613 [Ceratobasidium sp. 423]|nr:hypothetical protein FRC11_011613 [Ceratobasidium sp. 423]